MAGIPQNGAGRDTQVWNIEIPCKCNFPPSSDQKCIEMKELSSTDP
jgi:hypothetical protein